MTLGQIKSYTTAKLGITDATALTQAGEFAKARWRMIWNAANWRQSRFQDTVAVGIGVQDITLNSNFEFATAARWADNTELLPVNELNALATNPAGYDTAGQVVGFIQMGKDTSGNALLRLVSKPQQAKNLLVLGKRKCVELSADSDTPLIPGVDECLCAFVMGDLYQWIRQMSRAQVFFEEAQGLLGKMVDIETAQTAEIRRIIPIEQVLDDQASSSW